MSDPNADDTPPMGKGLSCVLIAIGGGMAMHFGLKIQESLGHGQGSAVGIGYVACFVLVGLGLMAYGLRMYQLAARDNSAEHEDTGLHPEDDR